MVSIFKNDNNVKHRSIKQFQFSISKVTLGRYLQQTLKSKMLNNAWISNIRIIFGAVDRISLFLL